MFCFSKPYLSIQKIIKLVEKKEIIPSDKYQFISDEFIIETQLYQGLFKYNQLSFKWLSLLYSEFFEKSLFFKLKIEFKLNEIHFHIESDKIEELYDLIFIAIIHNPNQMNSEIEFKMIHFNIQSKSFSIPLFIIKKIKKQVIQELKQDFSKIINYLDE